MGSVLWGPLGENEKGSASVFHVICHGTYDQASATHASLFSHHRL